MFKYIDLERKAFEESKKEDGAEEFYPSSRNESVIVNGINVLLAILETRKAVNSDESLPGMASMVGGGESVGAATPEESSKQQALLDAAISAILPRLGDLVQLLTHPPLRFPLKTTAGTLDPPLGATRLSATKLICALLSTNSLEVNKCLKELRVVDTLLVRAIVCHPLVLKITRRFLFFFLCHFRIYSLDTH